MKLQKPTQKGFTIVELLVVIVIIGILASVVVVAYNGISGRAVTASLQSDLTQAKKQIESYYTVNGVYPTANNCTNTLTTEICLKASPSNTLTYTTFTLNSQTTYSITATRGTTSNTVTGGTTPSIVTDGLVLHLDAGNPASYPGSGTTWTDLSGNNNNGTLINGPTYSSDNGGSIVFDGVNDGIVVAHDSAFDLTSEVTVCAILNQKGYSAVSQYQRITDKGSRLSSWLDDTDNKIYLRLSSSPNNFVLDYTFTQNQTYYIAWSYDKNTTDGRAKLYANGDLVATSDSQSGDIGTNTSDLYIGNWSSNTRPWKGPISYIKIYNRALTASEISQNFNAMRSRFNI